MSPRADRHPYAYTLALLKLAIDRLPPTFSAERAQQYRVKLDIFLNDPNIAYEEIQKTISALGKESWPYRKAYEEIYARYGRASEESHLLENLDLGIREKYERFIHEGGKIMHVRTVMTLEELMAPSPFERYFTPEEKFAIEQALLTARDSARAEIDDLVTGKKKEEYEALVEEYRRKQKRMEAKLDELRELATVSRKWQADISDRLRTIEEGWSVVEQGVDLADLEKETEYWKGTLEAFLKA